MREGSLCPHEDYVYFNWPTKEELKEIGKYQEQTAGVYRELLTGPEFTRMIATHKGLQDPEGYSEKFLEEPIGVPDEIESCHAFSSKDTR